MEAGDVSERKGVLTAIVSGALGGTAAAVTRYLVEVADPISIAILRWGIGLLVLLPVVLALGVKWPSRRDVPAVMGLGALFSGLFFIFYNIALATRPRYVPVSPWRPYLYKPCWWAQFWASSL